MALGETSTSEELTWRDDQYWHVRERASESERAEVRGFYIFTGSFRHTRAGGPTGTVARTAAMRGSAAVLPETPGPQSTLVPNRRGRSNQDYRHALGARRLTWRSATRSVAPLIHDRRQSGAGTTPVPERGSQSPEPDSAMPSRGSSKIYATDAAPLETQDPVTSKSAASNPHTDLLHRSQTKSLCSLVRRRLLRPVQLRYERTFSWPARQTLAVAVHMLAVVYVILSVPFRVAFLYDPFGKHNAWTPELTVLTALDVTADIIGAIEFVEKMQLRRDAFSRLTASVEFELGKKLWRDTAKSHARTSSAPMLRPQWTLATIGAALATPNGASTNSSVNRDQPRLGVRHLLDVLPVVLEALALAPFELILLATGSFNALHLARIPKLFRAHRVYDCVEQLTRIHSGSSWLRHLSRTGTSTLVRNVGLGLVASHWLACGYMLLAHAQCGIALEHCDPDVETSWVVRDQLFGAWIPRKYARSLYWGTRTVVLLGYSDVTPVSDAETLYICAAQLVGAIFSSSQLALCLFVFRYRNARHAAFAAHVDKAREYMKSQSLPRELRRKVAAFFNYTWATHQSLESDAALLNLPKHLQAKVVATLQASRVRQVCFLTKESTEFVNLLALSLHRRVYSPNDHVIEPKANSKMFFVLRGTVLLAAFDGSGVKECQAGDFFADACLLTPDNYEEQAVAKTFCELDVLDKSDFDAALNHFHRGRELQARLHMMDVLDKYAIQLRKTKQLLGMRGRHDSTRGSGMNIADPSANAAAALMTAAHTSKTLAWHLPGSVFRTRWDLGRLVTILYVAFEVPYFAAFISSHHAAHIFSVKQQLGLRYAVSLAAEVLFGVDLVLRARVFAFLDPVVMLPVVDPAMIFANYKANSDFWFDVAAWIPVGLVLESMAGLPRRYSWWFRLARLLRLRRVPQLVKDLVENYGMSSKFHLVMLLLLAVAWTLHIVGCIWFEMAWIFQPDTELHHDSAHQLTQSECLAMATGYQNCSWVIFDCYGQVRSEFPVYETEADSEYFGSFAYLRSLYWAVVALTTVGYGDIVAFSTAESYFASFWIFVSGHINFAVIGAMSSTLSTLTATQHHHVEKINSLNTTMAHAALSEGLRREIRRFYHLQFHRRKKAYESQLLSHLPDQLCVEISALLHADATKRVALFDSATREFLDEVTGKFRHRMYLNGETVCLEGDVCREFLVLMHGKANVFALGKKVPARALHDGDCYGVSEFLLKRSHTATVVTAATVEASVMTRDQFDVVQHKFADDYKDIREEALELWTEDQQRQRHVLANFDCLKLQQHVLQTPSLFYHRDQLSLANGGSGGGGGGADLGVSATKNQSGSKDPDVARSQFATAWGSLLTAWNMFNAFFVIFRICFHAHLNLTPSAFTAITTVDVVCDVCFAMDIYLQLYFFECADAATAWENLRQRREVSTHYKRSSRFKWDLVASLPLYVMDRHLVLASSICRLPRLVRCADLWVHLDEWIVQIQQLFASRNVSSYLSPLKLFIVFVLMAHWTGCIFFLISEFECTHDEHCWLKTDHLLHAYHSSVPSLYVRSFYWALTTLTLVGTSEIVSHRLPGTLWATLACLGCTFIMGHVLGELSELILAVDKEGKEHKRRIDSFERFSHEHQLPESLRTRVITFLAIQFKQSEGRDLNETMHDLSANLKLKLRHEVYGSPLLRLPITRFLTRSQVNNLALRLQEELFIPGDNIVDEDTLGTRLCILRRGAAAVFWTRSVTPVAVLLEGCLFGEVAFFLPDQRRLATVKATSSCEVLYVSKHDWQELWTSSGDANDAQVHRYAMHSILEWLMERLAGYQRCTLHIAAKAKRLLASRELAKANVATARKTPGPPLASVTRLGPSRSTWKQQERKLLRRRSADSAVSPATLLLEKKARYLLAKSDALAKKYHAELDSMQGHRRLSSRSVRISDHPADGGAGRRPSQNISARPTARTARGGNSNSAPSAFALQFVVHINPLNHHIRDLLDDAALRQLEAECWTRFKYVGAVRQTADDLVKSLDPEPSVARTATKAATSERRASVLRRARSVAARHRANNNRVTQIVKLGSMNSDMGLHPDGAFALLQQHAKMNAPAVEIGGGYESRPGTATSGVFEARGVDRARRFSRLMDANISRIKENQKIEEEMKHVKRCRSLPMFGRAFFHVAKTEEDERHRLQRSLAHGIQGTLHETPGVDFEILQRCQRPNFTSLFVLYRRYHEWKRQRRKATASMSSATSATSQRSQRNLLGMSNKRTGSSVVTPRQRLHSISSLTMRRWSSSLRMTLEGTSTDNKPGQEDEARTKEFMAFMTRLGKLWELTMLLVALYHFIVTPFKVCFASDLIELSTSHLTAWAVCEYLMDALCLLDVGYKTRRSIDVSDSLAHLPSHHGNSIRLALTKVWTHVSNALAGYPEFWTDVMALFPLELFVLAIAPTAHDEHDETFPGEWRLLWLLRLNRLLLVLRIEPLTERLFQFVVYELKVPVSEDALVFARSLCSYVALGHFIACIWYITSEHALSVYSYSWLSTDGMLVVSTSSSTSSSTTTSSHHRLLSSSSSSTFDLATVSLTRKYLRSLDYAMTSITTLFYGDIYSMNLIELGAEMAINLWSIYIYGALVGAHGRLLEEHSRRRATFENSLVEMQHYLVQNEIPKKLKKQIKQYYARMWRRRQGEPEFGAIEPLSRSLYRDVVFVTLRRFAWQVGIFHAMDVYFLRALLVALQYVVCSEGEEIVMTGDVDRSMYIIALGRVLVKHERGEVVKDKGDFFGELALLYGISRQETCVAMTVSELYRLDHEPYERVLLDFPDYRARNKLEWTTDAKTPPLATALHHFLRVRLDKAQSKWIEESGDTSRSNSIISSATTSRTSALNGVSNAVVPPGLDVDAELIEKEVPRSYVYHAAMTLLSRLSQLDSMEAKHIHASGQAAARRHLRKALGAAVPGLESDGDKTMPAASDPDNGVRRFSVGITTPRSTQVTPRRTAVLGTKADVFSRTQLLNHISFKALLNESAREGGSEVEDRPQTGE